MRETVSVILPSLNVAEYIGECLESVCNQTYENIEIICVDAGSTDETNQIIKEYKYKDKRIKSIVFGRKSYGAQVNHGIHVATGKYIAVVETDDFIEPEMIGKMYETANLGEVDYVKCDYKKFFCQRDGNYNYSSVYQFDNGDMEQYGIVINPHEMNCLYRSDYNIWRGLYKTSFLKSNNIKFNESDGAAYQDIGFMERIMASVNRAIYIKKTYYNYRTDRTEASSYSVKCLKNTMEEFRSYLEADVENTYLRGLYQHMAIAFLNEYEKSLIASEYDINSEYCKEYYKWFKGKITEALEQSILSLSLLKKRDSERLEILLESPQLFSDRCSKENLFRKKFYDELHADKILIFGAGRTGYDALHLLTAKGIKVCAFIDNDKQKQGGCIDGINVFSPEDALQRYKNVPVLVEHETKYGEIIDQIKGLKNDISVYCAYEGEGI